MTHADLALAERLERAEGNACAEFARSLARLRPESGATTLELGGALAAFSGIDSPITQCFGLGVLHDLNDVALDAVEKFFFDRGSACDLEVSPLAGVAALALLCARGYRPIEVSSVMYRRVEAPEGEDAPGVSARIIAPDEGGMWSEVSARGWASEAPELFDFVMGLGEVLSVRSGSVCFVAELDGVPGAAGALSFCDGVALFGGAATMPEFRRRGLQRALLRERMRFAVDHGCDLAMMVAQPGSDSQRNAERQGFRIAYTRTKWRRNFRAELKFGGS